MNLNEYTETMRFAGYLRVRIQERQRFVNIAVHFILRMPTFCEHSSSLQDEGQSNTELFLRVISFI